MKSMESVRTNLNSERFEYDELLRLHIQLFQSWETAIHHNRRFHLRLFVFNSFRIVGILFFVYSLTCQLCRLFANTLSIKSQKARHQDGQNAPHLFDCH
jgi:hypothetical protein